MPNIMQTINLQLVTALHGGGKLADYQVVGISNRIITTLCFSRSEGAKPWGRIFYALCTVAARSGNEKYGLKNTNYKINRI